MLNLSVDIHSFLCPIMMS